MSGDSNQFAVQPKKKKFFGWVTMTRKTTLTLTHLTRTAPCSTQTKILRKMGKRKRDEIRLQFESIYMSSNRTSFILW